MAKVELSEETKAGIEEVREADLLIAVTVPVDTEQLLSLLRVVLQAAKAQG